MAAKIEIPYKVQAKINGLISRGVKEINLSEDGDLYFILTDNSTAFLGNIKGAQGIPGENGFSPTLEIVSTEGGTRVIITDINGNKTFDIPDGKEGSEGKPGEPGKTPNIQIGEVVTLEPGTEATASITGTAEEPRLNLGIPKGEPGEGSEGGILQETDPTVPAWAKEANKPSYTAEEVGAEKAGAVAEHNVDENAHNDIRIELTALKNAIEAFLDIDDPTLDQLSELIAQIEANAGTIEQLTNGKVNVADIVNNLTTNASNKPLSAAQGVVLKRLVDAIKVPTKTSELTNDSGFITADAIPESGGAEEVYIGEEAPTDENIKIFIDTSEEAEYEEYVETVALLAETDMLPAVYDDSGILCDENRNVILRY